jgi:hypothetical protein
VKWAVCIITTNAAPPNAHPMRRRHRIECLQKISSFAWQCADAAIYVPHGTSPHLSIDEPTEMLPLLSRAFGFFVGTVAKYQSARAAATPAATKIAPTRLDQPEIGSTPTARFLSG